MSRAWACASTRALGTVFVSSLANDTACCGGADSHFGQPYRRRPGQSAAASRQALVIHPLHMQPSLFPSQVRRTTYLYGCTVQSTYRCTCTWICILLYTAMHVVLLVALLRLGAKRSCLVCRVGPQERRGSASRCGNKRETRQRCAARERAPVAARGDDGGRIAESTQNREKQAARWAAEAATACLPVRAARPSAGCCGRRPVSS